MRRNKKFLSSIKGINKAERYGSSSVRGKKLSIDGKKLSVAGITSLGILGLVTLAAITPATTMGADALDNTARSAMSRVTVDAAATISISLGEAVDVEVTPRSAGEFAASQTELSVMTNNPEGYTIHLATANGESSLKNVKAGLDTQDYQIESITTNMAGKDFVGNTWGYALLEGREVVTSDTTFSPVPTSLSTTVYDKSGASIENGEVYQLGFGTMVDGRIAAGQYSNSVIASVVAKPSEITSLADLVFMQDMTPEICANTPSAWTGTTTDRNSEYYLNPIEKKVADVRDGKKYYVAKLADGNCWMTQNLAFDLKAGQVLTSATTDVKEDWVVPTSTETEIPAKTTADYTSTRSWNLGEIVLKNPTGSTVCDTPLPEDLKNQGYENREHVSAWHGQSLANQCPSFYQDVTGMDGGYEATETNTISGGAYDAHYLIGNYYQWGTATAGTGIITNASNTTEDGLTDSAVLVDAISSICPKGWELPKSGRYWNKKSGNEAISWPYSRDNSFYNLLYSYNYPETGKSVADSNLFTTQWFANDGTPYTGIISDTGIRLDFNPMNFVRSGYIYPTFGALYFAGHNGIYWSSTAYPGSTERTYYLSVSPDRVAPSSNNFRYNGTSIRCLAK